MMMKHEIHSTSEVNLAVLRYLKEWECATEIIHVYSTNLLVRYACMHFPMLSTKQRFSQFFITLCVWDDNIRASRFSLS